MFRLRCAPLDIRSSDRSVMSTKGSGATVWRHLISKKCPRFHKIFCMFEKRNYLCGTKK
jgi:hypothetical protein